ncbi:pilus assembly protein TadG-related protein [Streptomyces griseus]|uniref:pilus assembly protein TadG-related protein n=1 Tax=Streptomyces griseus TaxID=1911 RepID=UPI0005673374
MRCAGKESGQAFPAYVAVISGLLFLAFVYFAVGRAAALRGDAQTAADAAALGAAQDARDQLRERWLEVMDNPTQWQRFVRGGEEEYLRARACQRAAVLASLNDAELLPGKCERIDLGFTVTVRTEGTVGESIVPGTDEQKSTARASAVIEPLCVFEPPSIEPPREPPSGTTAEPDPSDTPSEDPEEEDPEPISVLECESRDWEIDPEDPVLPGADELFRVRLTGDDE